MRPTFSIIFFTVMSGSGYGLWFFAAIALALISPTHPTTAGDAQLAFVGFVCLVLGLVLVSAGLVSSLGHLGQPQRAWRALSQWRSSWLSREGVAAIATYVPALALLALLFSSSLPAPSAVRPFGAALAIGAMLTVVCTANIYACLKPIRAWHNGYVVPGYLLLGLYAGLLFLWALTTLPGTWRAREASALLIGLVVVATVSALLKVFYWRHIDRDAAPGAGHATGLESLGTVRSFEQPHTEENYLTHEMGFVLARKHSRKLRTIALVAGFVVPALLAALGLAMPASSGVVACLALGSGMSGIFVERWLFFAEAKHAVMAYYAR